MFLYRQAIKIRKEDGKLNRRLGWYELLLIAVFPLLGPAGIQQQFSCSFSAAWTGGNPAIAVFCMLDDLSVLIGSGPHILFNENTSYVANTYIVVASL